MTINQILELSEGDNINDSFNTYTVKNNDGACNCVELTNGEKISYQDMENYVQGELEKKNIKKKRRKRTKTSYERMNKFIQSGKSS